MYKSGSVSSIEEIDCLVKIFLPVSSVCFLFLNSFDQYSIKLIIMKRSSFIGNMGVVIALLIGVGAEAQFAYSRIEPQKTGPFHMGSTKENVSTPTYYNEINPRAMRHFLTHFSEASGEKWYSTPDMIAVMFTLKGIDYRVDFDKKGNWIETFRNYDETKLSSDLRRMIKESYPAYKILIVQEIEQLPHPIIYIVHLEGETKLINLEICDGVMKEWQKFEKSK